MFQSLVDGIRRRHLINIRIYLMIIETISIHLPKTSLKIFSRVISVNNKSVILFKIKYTINL